MPTLPLTVSIAGKLTSQNHSGFVTDVCTNLLVTTSILFLTFSYVQIRRVITGVYFSAG